MIRNTGLGRIKQIKRVEQVVFMNKLNRELEERMILAEAMEDLKRLVVGKIDGKTGEC
ncbi:hypothetical protein KKC08_04370 [Patescibacteria group bacterium]|nr:hypothetical protein [Patescibacteria group bacterium]MCG2702422.1 hypothetical protein [Candidatus Parcubacteria bacterium]MBU4264528.1 hypothetical protein [Patescibacteria group bacterium]MBU4390459.1 hypothetical protein [Patescibacteria group bacterium]MBU4397375.1 hypothetical protein [Patescibacteria group bacterium]